MKVQGFLHVLYLVLFSIVFFLLFSSWFKGCGKNNTEASHKDTSVVLNYTVQPTQTSPQIQPIILETKNPSSIPVQYIVSPLQGTENAEELLRKYQVLLTKYDSVLRLHIDSNRYDNRVALRDSAGHDLGEVKIPQTVTQNKLLPFQAQYTLKFPSTTKTILEPEHNQLWAGIGLAPDIWAIRQRWPL
jgi:hypothetical protein